MRDQEQDQEYPKHQPGRSGHNHHDPFEPHVQDEGELEDLPRSKPVHQRDAATTPQLPLRHASKALIVGIILGVLASLQGVFLTLQNAAVYKQAANYITSTVPLNIAIAIFKIGALSLVISLLIYFIGGLVIGRISVRRRWAFIGGFVGGVLNSVIAVLLKLIPSYPDAGNTGFSGNILGIGGGLIALLIGTILLGVLTGLICLLGGWLMTRRHPYYVGYYG